MTGERSDTTPTTPPPRITFEELLHRLEDPATPPEDVTPYLILDPDASGPFSPVIVANPALVELPMVEAAVFMAIMNGWSRRVRTKKYRERRASSPDVVPLVSEGDSWFQYPFILQDVVDQLNQDHAVLCSAAAGDKLTDMIAQDELVAAVLAEDPEAILISAGGNDLLGKIQTLVEPFAGQQKPEEYLGATFDTFLDALSSDYRRFLLRLLEHAGEKPIYCHSYDYALPRSDGRWLGRPMKSIGIEDPTVQQAIVRLMVDRFHEALDAIVQEPSLAGRVTLVDCRGTVPANAWHDELHPTNRGYALVANLFRAAMGRTAPLDSFESFGSHEGVPAPATEQEAMAEAALTLSRGFDETALLHELGRRQQLIEADPATSTIGLATVSSSSYESVYDSFRDVGHRIMRRIYGHLVTVACGDETTSGGDARLATAIEAGRAALARYLVASLGSTFALPVAVGTVAAALVLRSVVARKLPAVCEEWRTRAAEG